MAQFAASLRHDDLPADVRDRARLVLLDALGCGLAGSTTEELRLIREAVRAAAGAGDTLLWGTPDRAPLPLAALANGAAVHAREMDDFEGCLHSGSVIIPAAFGTAVRAGASGRELLTAIVVGYDIARRALEGSGGNRPLKDKGWHSTSVCGGFGAAAAVARLLRLDAERTQWALGYAGSNAGGTWAFIPDGAMSKRVHPGFAAQSGVVSAYLAASRVTGPTCIFESDWGGFFPTYAGDKAEPEKATAGLGSDFRIRIVGFKPYAACRGNHGSIDAILELRREANILPETVTRVVVRGSRTHVKQLGKQDVQTMLDAQFSLPYSIAVALATGGAMLDQYTPEALRRPEILALARRVEVVHDEQVTTGEQPFVDVHLTDGRVLTRRVLIPRGDRRNPLSEDELRAKFRSNASLVLGGAQAARLEEAVARVSALDNVGELAALLAPPAGRAR
ncbi:MAG: MmgE/PrpD family protein [Betaproteobacteria bacterium]|nr:MmgE/PrpD family protein [Betaproteobacteria bacterium]